jgi:hypothetical protein
MGSRVLMMLARVALIYVIPGRRARRRIYGGVPFALKAIALMPLIGLLIAWLIPYPPKRSWKAFTPSLWIH